MSEKEKELALVVGYIMYNDLLEDSEFDGSYFHKIYKVIELAEEFIGIYPHDFKWEDADLDWDEAIEHFIVVKLK